MALTLFKIKVLFFSVATEKKMTRITKFALLWGRYLYGDVIVYQFHGGVKRQVLIDSIWNNFFNKNVRIIVLLPCCLSPIESCMKNWHRAAIFGFQWYRHCDWITSLARGTTAHATLNLNRQDDKGNRRYILIEMDDMHFESVLKPRVKKAVYAEKWKAGKPASRDSRLSHMFKYQRLESYEDVLNSIEFTEQNQDQSFFDTGLLSYLLGTETSGKFNITKYWTTPISV